MNLGEIKDVVEIIDRIVESRSFIYLAVEVEELRKKTQNEGLRDRRKPQMSQKANPGFEKKKPCYREVKGQMAERWPLNMAARKTDPGNNNSSGLVRGKPS